MPITRPKSTLSSAPFMVTRVPTPTAPGSQPSGSRTGESLFRLQHPDGVATTQMALNHSGDLVAVHYEDDSVVVLEVEDGSPRATLTPYASGATFLEPVSRLFQPRRSKVIQP